VLSAGPHFFESGPWDVATRRAPCFPIPSYFGFAFATDLFRSNPRSARERKGIREMVCAVFHSDLVECRGPDWKTITCESRFALSPRGIVVGTYELIRIETLPMLVSGDVHWLACSTGANVQSRRTSGSSRGRRIVSRQ
jgi:hypothetical protein